MGALWDYFKNTLRFPLIFSPGPLAQVSQGGAEVLDNAKEDELWLRKQFLPSLCDDGFLARFAASRGIRRWPYESNALWRDRVIRAYVFFMLGGKKAGLEAIFDAAGLQAEIKEPRDMRDAWIRSGGVRLDGTWQVDGSEKLIAPYSFSGAWLLAWAEFLIEAELDSLVDKSLLRSVVAEFKPARSIPAYRFYGMSEFVQDHELESSGLIRAETNLSGWNCGLRLDGTWGLGRAIRLDGAWCLNRGWKVGQIWPRGIIVNKLDSSRALDGTWQLDMVLLPHHKILDCRLETGGLIQTDAEMPLFRSRNYFQVSADSPVPLDGDYQLGRVFARWPDVTTNAISSFDRDVYFGGTVNDLPEDVQIYLGGSATELPDDVVDSGDAGLTPVDVLYGLYEVYEPPVLEADDVIYPEMFRIIYLGGPVPMPVHEGDFGTPFILPDDIVFSGNAQYQAEDVIDYGLLPRMWYFGGESDALPRHVILDGLDAITTIVSIR